MPARRLRLRCSHFFTLMSVVFFVPALVQAQTDRASATVRGSVSSTVALSVAPSFTDGVIDATVLTSSGSTVRLTLTSRDTGSRVIRIPLLVRSNSSFKVTAALESGEAVVAQLSVADVRATGKWVARGVNSTLNVAGPLDLNSQPLFVLSGPRVSLGGTLQSPNNALEVTVLIRLTPHSVPGSPIHLTFVGIPE
jgi:hypothetical protein